MLQRDRLRAHGLDLIESLLNCGAQVVLLSKNENRCRDMTRKFANLVHYCRDIQHVESIRICSNLISQVFHCRSFAYIVPLISSMDLDLLAYDSDNDEELMHLTGYLTNELLPVMMGDPDRFPAIQ